jgi:hypothetical protein
VVSLRSLQYTVADAFMLSSALLVARPLRASAAVSLDDANGEWIELGLRAPDGSSTASSYGDENPPSERKRREGGPCYFYPALHSFANACHFLKPPCAACSGSSRFRGWTPCPRPPETRGVQGQKRTHRPIPCVACLPPLRRLEEGST